MTMLILRSRSVTVRWMPQTLSDQLWENVQARCLQISYVSWSWQVVDLYFWGQISWWPLMQNPCLIYNLWMLATYSLFSYYRSTLLFTTYIIEVCFDKLQPSDKIFVLNVILLHFIWHMYNKIIENSEITQTKYHPVILSDIVTGSFRRGRRAS